jgi:PadR family transcriptional regulator PadR
MRMTRNLIRVAGALMAEPNGRHWGYNLSKRSGVRAGAMYPMLTKFLDNGWMTDGWEDPETITEARPPRRYYELTRLGKSELGAILASASTRRPMTSRVRTA